MYIFFLLLAILSWRHERCQGKAKICAKAEFTKYVNEHFKQIFNAELTSAVGSLPTVPLSVYHLVSYSNNYKTTHHQPHSLHGDRMIMRMEATSVAQTRY